MAAARAESAWLSPVADGAGSWTEAAQPRLVRRSVVHRAVERLVLRAVGPVACRVVGSAACQRAGSGACQAMVRRDVRMAERRSPAGSPKGPAAVECQQQAVESCRAEAAGSALRLGQAKARPRRRGRASPVHASGLRLPASARNAEVRQARAAALPAESAQRASAAVQAVGAGSAQREALPPPEERAVAVQHGAVPQPEAAVVVLVAAAGPLLGAAEAALGAVAGLPSGVAEAAALVAVAERLPGVVAAEPGAAAGPQPEAAVGAERDGAGLPQAAGHAAGLPQAAALSVLPSASVCRRGRLRPRAVPPAPRPVAYSARGKRSLQSAAPKWRWWQAAQGEV